MRHRLLLVGMVALVAESSTRAESMLATRTGDEFGLSLSSYRYQEPGFMSNRGPKVGLDLRKTKAFQNTFFVRGDLRFAIGSVDYYAPTAGSATGQPDFYIETRGIVGKDETVGVSVLSVYAGLGYRYLYNDARGLTSGGAVGYRRESNYLYLPIGVIHRIALDEQARLVSEVEYDQWLVGQQLSKLSDNGLGWSDSKNFQHSGYGIKLSVRYEQANWAVGPYAHYWNVGDSFIVPLYQNGRPVYKNGLQAGWQEPKNNTLEFGLKVSRQF
ncbi:MAG: hypothetical protein ABL873_03835 [Gallionella sp.]